MPCNWRRPNRLIESIPLETILFEESLRRPSTRDTRSAENDAPKVNRDAGIVTFKPRTRRQQWGSYVNRLEYFVAFKGQGLHYTQRTASGDDTLPPMVAPPAGGRTHSSRGKPQPHSTQHTHPSFGPLLWQRCTSVMVPEGGAGGANGVLYVGVGPATRKVLRRVRKSWLCDRSMWTAPEPKAFLTQHHDTPCHQRSYYILSRIPGRHNRQHLGPMTASTSQTTTRERPHQEKPVAPPLTKWY
ncbi:unnamed protein product [Ectocarpus sp. 6 AP-2014]